jgi:hypothetical protein
LVSLPIGLQFPAQIRGTQEGAFDAFQLRARGPLLPHGFDKQQTAGDPAILLVHGQFGRVASAFGAVEELSVWGERAVVGIPG